MLLLWVGHLVATPGIQRINYETPHFILNIDKEKESVLPELAQICEENYVKLSAVFDYRLKDPIRVVFFDESDFSNGYALGFKNWVGIYLPSTSFQLRGASGWKRNVIAHELAHVFTLRKLGYTKLYLGHTSAISLSGEDYLGNASHSYSPHSLENWLAEGLAQIGAELAGYDYWDSHREMLQRVAYHDDKILELGELKTFWGDKRQNEQLYNQGYSFLRFVLSERSVEQFEKILRKGRKVALKKAIAKTYGISFKAVYQKWQSHLEEKYGPRKADEVDLVSETKMTHRGNYIEEKSPIYTDDGLVFLSSHKNDFGQTHLYKAEKKKIKLIKRNVTGPLKINQNKTRILFAQKEYKSNRRVINELYSLDLKTLKEEKLTRYGRVMDADYYGDSILVLRHLRGQQHIQKLWDGKFENFLSSDSSFEINQIAYHSFSNSVIVSVVSRLGRDLMTLDLSSKNLKPLICTKFDERDPFIVGNTLYYSSDRTGIFQIYSTELASPSISKQLTVVKGGAFRPFVREGQIYFESFGAKGYVVQTQALGQHEIIDSVEVYDLGVEKERPLPSFLKPTKHNANGLGFLGVSSNLLYLREPLPVADSLPTLGRKIGFGGAVNFADASFENTAVLSLLLLKTLENPNSQAIDPVVFGQFTTASYSPILDFQASYSLISLHTYRTDSTLEFEFEPTVALFNAQNSIYWPLNEYVFFENIFGYQNLGIGISGIVASLIVQSGYYDRVILGYQLMNPGVDFINSGIWIASSFGFDAFDVLRGSDSLFNGNLDPTTSYQGEQILSASLLGGVRTNLYRVLFGGVEGQINYQKLVDGGDEVSFLGKSNLSVYLPWKYFSVPVFHGSLAFKNMYINLGYAYQNLNDDGLVRSYRKGKYGGSFHPRTSIHPYSFLGIDFGDRKGDQDLSVSLNAKVLTFYNFLSFWTIGASHSLKGSVDDVSYYFNINF